MRWRAAVALCLAVMMAGCNLSAGSKKIDYKSAGKLPPLEIPPDLTALGTEERYAVPEISSTGTATFSAYSKDRNKQPGTGGTSILPLQRMRRCAHGALRYPALAGGKR